MREHLTEASQRQRSNNNLQQRRNLPVAYVQPWKMANEGDEFPISETKRSFQRKPNLNKERFVKPRVGVTRSSSMMKPSTSSVSPNVSTWTVPRRSPSYSTKSGKSTEALLSPRYRESDNDIFSGHDQEDVNRNPEANIQSRKKGMALNFPNDKSNALSNRPISRKTSSTNLVSRYIPRRQLFQTSDELLESIHTNLNTSNHSQSSDAIHHPSNDEQIEHNKCAQSSENIYCPMFPHYQSSEGIPIPTMTQSYPSHQPHYLSCSADVFQFTENYFPPALEENYAIEQDVWPQHSNSSDMIDRLPFPSQLHAPPQKISPDRFSLGTFQTKSMGDVRGPVHRTNTSFFMPLVPLKGNSCRHVFNHYILITSLYVHFNVLRSAST